MSDVISVVMPAHDEEAFLASAVRDVAEGMRARGHRMVKTVSDANDLASALRDVAAEGDIIICMGAGDITKWAAGLADGIAKARASK